MKRLKIIIILIVILGSLVNCKAQSQLSKINTYINQIEGTWISQDNSNHKIEFSSEGTYKVYIESNLVSTYTYALTISCSSSTNNGYDVYLRIKDDNDIVICNIINNISINSDGETILSLTTESGKLEIFKKE